MKLHVLIVDDNSSFLGAASTLLEREGLSVDGVASTGAEALRQAEVVRPDVVLVDVFLGKESGLQVARELVADGRAVILISTHDEAELRELIAESPALGFLSKPDLSAEGIREIVDGRRGD
jgi:CheY-like chemotaxis protein